MNSTEPDRTAVDRSTALVPAAEIHPKGHTHQLFPAEWRKVRAAIKWRDPARLFLLALRELLRPLAYWYAIDLVETDLSLPPPAPYGPRSFEVRVFRGRDDLEKIASVVLPLGELNRSEIEERCQRGDAIGIAYAEKEPVGYSWITFCSGMELVLGLAWVVHPNQAVFYGSFVPPPWRGKGIHSWLDLEMNNYARQRGITRTFGSMSWLNSGSLSLAKRQQKPVVMTVFALEWHWPRWRYYRTFGRPLDAHLRISRKDP